MQKKKLLVFYFNHLLNNKDILNFFKAEMNFNCKKLGWLIFRD